MSSQAKEYTTKEWHNWWGQQILKAIIIIIMKNGGEEGGVHIRCILSLDPTLVVETFTRTTTLNKLNYWYSWFKPFTTECESFQGPSLCYLPKLMIYYKQW